jgi:hypothetical protein
MVEYRKIYLALFDVSVDVRCAREEKARAPPLFFVIGFLDPDDCSGFFKRRGSFFFSFFFFFWVPAAVFDFCYVSCQLRSGDNPQASSDRSHAHGNTDVGVGVGVGHGHGRAVVLPIHRT